MILIIIVLVVFIDKKLIGEKLLFRNFKNCMLLIFTSLYAIVFQ